MSAANPAFSSAIAGTAGSAESPVPDAVETSPPTDLETPVETPVEIAKNVLPFRPLNESKLGDPRSPTLTPVENSAFNELARQLSARLESETGDHRAAPAVIRTARGRIEPPGRAGNA